MRVRCRITWIFTNYSLVSYTINEFVDLLGQHGLSFQKENPLAFKLAITKSVFIIYVDSDNTAIECLTIIANLL